MKTNPKAGALRWALLFLASIIVIAGSYLHVADNFELQTLDMRFRLRGTIPTSDRIVIIEIGDDTLSKIGHFPFSRSYHAILVKALAEAGAKAIVFDLFFNEPSSSDDEFAKAVKQAGNVYLSYIFKIEHRVKAGMTSSSGIIGDNVPVILEAAKGTGHINVIPDIDGKYRRVPAYVEYEGTRYPYVTFKVACDLLGIAESDIRFLPGSSIEIARGPRIPLDENSLFLVNYTGPWGHGYRHYSYADIVQSYLARLAGKKPHLDLSVFRDKVCYIGLTAAGTVDLHPNPFDTLYPAVGLHTEVLNSMLSGRFVSRAPRAAHIAILIFLGAVVSAIVLRTKPMQGLFFFLSAVSAYTLIAILLFIHFGLWIDIAYPVAVIIVLHISLTLSKYVREWRQRLFIENELEIAKKIQESFLPKATPEIDGVRFGAAMFTARQVGGDLYDFTSGTAGSSRGFGVMIGDVSGKGVGAALFMAMTVGAFKLFSKPERRPEDVLAELNAKLVKESTSNLFVTMFYAVFDLEREKVIFANGGHLPALRVSANGAPQFLDVKDGSPLGLIDGPYSGGEARFDKGDVFIFYTDGITEAMNAKSDMYGKERLEAVCVKHRALGPERLVEEIERDVRRFEPKQHQHDDMTILVVKII
jgi:serine phosphatase RsbU (regulator of sigma subunit)/CHASE2 domain-containing sensor protein